MEHLAFFEWDQLEYRRLLTGMIVPANRRSVLEMREAFGTILGNRPIFPFNMARTALATAFQIFRRARPHANEVIVPSYICPGVIEAAQAAGLRPVPGDIGPDFNLQAAAVEELISPRTLAVLAAHMYGCPAPIREIEAICRRRNVFLVDDSAQVVGLSVHGRPLGTFGDIGLVSFSQSKTVVTGSHNAGGLLIVNNPELQSRVRQAYAALPEARGYTSDFVTFFWNYILARWTETPSYYFARIFRRASKPAPTRFETATKIHKVMAMLALEQLKSLQGRIAGRRRVAELYHRKVSSQRTIGFPQFAPGRYLTRIILTVPRGANLKKIRADLFRNGVRTRGGYPVFTWERAPRPEQALNMQPRLIELPSRSEMSSDTVDKIWRVFDACVGPFDEECNNWVNDDREFPSRRVSSKR